VTRKQFAVKAVKKSLLIVDDDVESAMTEKKVLAMSHQHPFLTTLHSCFQTKVVFIIDILCYIPTLIQPSCKKRCSPSRWEKL